MILLFGSSGLLGWYIYEYFKDFYEILPITSNEFNILTDQVIPFIEKYKPSIIINCTNAFNNSFKDQLHINSLFPYKLSKLKNVHVIHISTNGVFSGMTGNYDEDSPSDALDAYGITKLLGETDRVTVIRTSILGESKRNKNCFMEWLKTQKKIIGFDNHYWNGVTCLYLAKYIKYIIDNNRYWYGVRHIYDETRYSKYELANTIKSIYHLDLSIEKDTNQYKDLCLKTKFKSFFRKPNLMTDLLEQKIFTSIRNKQVGVYENRLECRFCKTMTDKILHLGDRFGLAGGFLKSKDEEDYVYPLTLRLCPSCNYIQCQEEVSPDQLFKKHYFYFSSMIPSLVKHFKEFAEWIQERYPKDSKIIEIGCNDGVLLHPLLELGFENLIGIDPSHTIKNIDSRIMTFPTYFNGAVTNLILDKYGPQDLFISCNSFAHINDMDSILKNMKRILKEDTGIALIEVHYSKHIFENKQFDFIYHEHVGYYTITSLYNICCMYGLSLVDVIHIPNHGGSIRCVIQNKITQDIPLSILTWMQQENFLFSETFFKEYQEDLFSWKETFKTKMYQLIADGKKVYGYGASGRANTLLNFTEITLEGIIDDALSKIGCFTPTLNIPIVDSSILYSDTPPDYVVILAYPYADYIMEKHTKYKGIFIIPLPDIRDISSYEY